MKLMQWWSLWLESMKMMMMAPLFIIVGNVNLFLSHFRFPCMIPRTWNVLKSISFHESLHKYPCCLWVKEWHLYECAYCKSKLCVKVWVLCESALLPCKIMLVVFFFFVFFVKMDLILIIKKYYNQDYINQHQFF